MRTTILSVLLAVSLSLEIAGASSSGVRVHRIAHPAPAPNVTQPVPQQPVRPAVQQPRRHPVLLNATAAPFRPDPAPERRESPLVQPKAKPVAQPAPVAEPPAPARPRMRVAPLAPREVSHPVPTALPVEPKPVAPPLAPVEQPAVVAVPKASPRRIQPRSSTATIHRRSDLRPVATAPAPRPVPVRVVEVAHRPQPVQVATTPRGEEVRKAPMIHRIKAPVAESAIAVPPPAPKRVAVVAPPPVKPVPVEEPEPVTNRGPHSVVFSSPYQTPVVPKAAPRRGTTPTVIRNGAPAFVAPQPVPSNRPRRRLPIAPLNSSALPPVPAS